MTIQTFLSNQGVISSLITTFDKKAVLIDPSFDMAQSLVKTIEQNQLELVYILETHTHADFFSSRKLFKALYPKAEIGLSKFSPTTDNQLKLEDNQILSVQEIKIEVWQAFGHTNESLAYLVKNDNQDNSQLHLFSGDSLLIGGTGRTDFQLGDSRSLYFTLERFLRLDDSTIIYPCHNYNGQTRTTLGVEKLTNSRLKMVLEGKKDQFITTMDNHKPSVPELFEESLAWNSI
jgi:glyoxylase-like metal-dependent hydrolase (beta-lactamase superfamily II)